METKIDIGIPIILLEKIYFQQQKITKREREREGEREKIKRDHKNKSHYLSE